MRNRNRWFRNTFGFGKNQMEMLGMINQFGKPVVSQNIGRNRGSKQGSGPGGNCICPECGLKVAHITGIPCNQIECSKCGIKMIKE